MPENSNKNSSDIIISLNVQDLYIMIDCSHENP